MAITHTGATGTGTSSTSASSFTLTTATTAYTDGNVGILRVATDNISTADGATNDHTSVTGWTGTVTKLGEYTNTVGGAAGDGATVSLWALECGSAGNAVGTVLTINLSAACVDKAAGLNRYTKAAGTTLQIAGSAQYTTADATTAPGSLTISGLSSTQRLYVRAIGMEGNTTTTLTATTNFTGQTTIRSRFSASAVSLASEFRIVVATGETSNPTLPISADSASVFVALEEVTSGQTLTPSLFTNTNTIYGPTVTPGAVTLTPSLYSNANAFYAATVSQGGVGQTLTPALFSNTTAFYAATVTAGAVTLATGLLTNSSAFYAPTVTPGTVGLVPALLVNANTFYGPVIAVDPTQSLAAPFLTNSNTFYPASLLQITRRFTAMRVATSPSADRSTASPRASRVTASPRRPRTAISRR